MHNSVQKRQLSMSYIPRFSQNALVSGRFFFCPDFRDLGNVRRETILLAA